MNKPRSIRRARETGAIYQAVPFGATDLEKITRRIVPAVHPEMIIFFGSRAYGMPRPDSDLDLMVVMDNNSPSHSERIAPLKKLFSNLPIRLDIQARTPAVVTD